MKRRSPRQLGDEAQGYNAFRPCPALHLVSTAGESYRKPPLTKSSHKDQGEEDILVAHQLRLAPPMTVGKKRSAPSWLAGLVVRFLRSCSFRTFRSRGPVRASLLMLLFSCLSYEGRGAQTLEIKGELHYTTSTPQQDVRFGFSVLVNGCRWQIRTMKNPFYPTYGYRETGFDGTNLYEYSLFVPGFFGNTSTEHVGRANGAVKSALFPEHDNAGTAQLWLAFASRCYVRTHLNSLPCALLFSPRTQTNSDCSLEVQETFDANDPGTLLSAIYFNKGNGVAIDGTVPELPPPYDHGYTNYTYTVVKTAREGILDVPVGFRFQLFWPRQGSPRTEDLIIASELDGVVTSVDLNANIPEDRIGRPSIVTETFVQDFRTAFLTTTNVSAISYYTTNDWLPTNSPQYAVAVDAAEHSNDYSHLAVSNPGFLRAFVLFFLVSTSTILVLLLKKRRLSREQQ
jgi:hypothetical protein